MKVVRVSESAVLVLFEQVISPEKFSTVKRSFDLIESHLVDYLTDIVISYASIHVSFNILKISNSDFSRKVSHLLTNIETDVGPEVTPRIQEIPVYYGAEVALDLDIIAERANLSAEAVVDIHSNHVYDVYAIGFAPGFAYLGNVDERIACPRKETPRKKIAKGSLGIADRQTAIYPSASPGGWQIIGRTPITLVDFDSENLTPFSTGDKVKFIPISKEQYIDMGGEF
jgi:KipI family sensor histidine kinase inhibitor